MNIDVIGKNWKVEKLLGEGSFGKVYKIVKQEFGQTFEAALKVIDIPQTESEIKTIKSEGFDDDAVKDYFRSVAENIVQESQLMYKLKGNSNIVSYEDHIVEEKSDGIGYTIYIRMELLTPFIDFLNENTFTVADVIKLGIDICKALEVCKQYNIVHRDIKPENIFISDTGDYKLGDFGIAKEIEKTTGMSKKGTYTYVAPEVFKGEAYNSSVDIYSLGVVMYRLLNNNRTPFLPTNTTQIKVTDKEQANMRRLRGEPIPKPCNADDNLSRIILKACAYNPIDRFNSPSEMRIELESLLSQSTSLGYVVENRPNEYIYTDSKSDLTADNEETSLLVEEDNRDTALLEEEDNSDTMLLMKEDDDNTSLLLEDDEDTSLLPNNEAVDGEADTELLKEDVPLSQRKDVEIAPFTPPQVDEVERKIQGSNSGLSDSLKMTIFITAFILIIIMLIGYGIAVQNKTGIDENTEEITFADEDYEDEDYDDVDDGDADEDLNEDDYDYGDDEYSDDSYYEDESY